ncbi:MAG: cytochrome c-type biogenesis protein CcmH [Chloroflexota bacterium]|jgi:cytochrome c-type biogenesis protein CcmH|nr:cytochrome c-type biogenesis protein CcmH [Chloroflexota bacterium]
MTYNKLLKIGISIILIFSINACFASQNNSEESLYIKLEKEIMCPVCDGQTLDQSQSLIADDMKNTIKKKIQEGYNEEEIKIYFIKRYGNSVLAYPTMTGFNAIAYIIPSISVVIGILILGLYIKRDKIK